MAKEDYLLRQIHLMSIFLQKLIKRIRKKEEDSESFDSFEMVSNSFYKEWNIKINELIFLENEDLLSILKEQNFNTSNLEELANLLYILGSEKYPELILTHINCLQKAIFLYSFVDEQTESFSMIRNSRITEIEQMLNNQ